MKQWPTGSTDISDFINRKHCNIAGALYVLALPSFITCCNDPLLIHKIPILISTEFPQESPVVASQISDYPGLLPWISLEMHWLRLARIKILGCYSKSQQADESAARSLEKGYLGITVCVKRQLFTSQAA